MKIDFYAFDKTFVLGWRHSSCIQCGQIGYTLIEMLIVVTLVGTIVAIVIPAFRSFHEESCVRSALHEIAAMIREAKQNALGNDSNYAVGFVPETRKVVLISEKGADGDWNTGDDTIVRSLQLADKAWGIRFGYGRYGPLPDHASDPDGITFQLNNTLVCNSGMTGNAGAVYLISQGGVAMAIALNSIDSGYTLWKWNGKKWARL